MPGCPPPVFVARVLGRPVVPMLRWGIPEKKQAVQWGGGGEEREGAEAALCGRHPFSSEVLGLSRLQTFPAAWNTGSFCRLGQTTCGGCRVQSGAPSSRLLSCIPGGSSASLLAHSESHLTQGNIAAGEEEGGEAGSRLRVALASESRSAGCVCVKREKESMSVHLREHECVPVPVCVLA